MVSPSHDAHLNHPRHYPVLISLNKVSTEHIREKRLSGVLLFKPPAWCNASKCLLKSLSACRGEEDMVDLPHTLCWILQALLCACFTDPRSNKNGWRSDLSHGPSDRSILFLLLRCCFMLARGIRRIPLFPISSFLFLFLFPPLLSPPVESEFFSHNCWFLGRLILKSYSFIRPPSGLRVWLSVTDPERSCLILHKDRQSNVLRKFSRVQNLLSHTVIVPYCTKLTWPLVLVEAWNLIVYWSQSVYKDSVFNK